MIKTIIVYLVLALVSVFGIGIIQDQQNSLSYMLRDCTKTSDNNGYIGYTCPDEHYFIPASERDQLPR